MQHPHIVKMHDVPIISRRLYKTDNTHTKLEKLDWIELCELWYPHSSNVYQTVQMYIKRLCCWKQGKARKITRQSFNVKHIRRRTLASHCYVISHFREYSVPASGYDWVAFGNLESPAIDIALQVDFTRLRLWPKGKNTTFSILLVRYNSFLWFC